MNAYAGGLSAMDWKAEAIGFLAQGAFFLAGLVLSLFVGILLAAHVDGTGGLLVATVIAGAGLLASANYSQSLREHLLEKRYLKKR